MILFLPVVKSCFRYSHSGFAPDHFLNPVAVLLNDKENVMQIVSMGRL